MDRETERSISPGGYVGSTTSDGFSVTTIGVTVVGVVTVVTVGGSVVGCVVGISEVTTEGVSEVVSVVTSECVVTGGSVVGVSVVDLMEGGVGGGGGEEERERGEGREGRGERNRQRYEETISYIHTPHAQWIPLSLSYIHCMLYMYMHAYTSVTTSLWCNH